MLPQRKPQRRGRLELRLASNVGRLDQAAFLPCFAGLVFALASAEEKGEAAGALFSLSFFGFFFSRMLCCSRFAMIQDLSGLCSDGSKLLLAGCSVDNFSCIFVHLAGLQRGTTVGPASLTIQSRGVPFRYIRHSPRPRQQWRGILFIEPPETLTHSIEVVLIEFS